MANNIRYSQKEELWNAYTHGFGILMGVVVGSFLLTWSVQADNKWAIIGVAIYLFGMLSSYISSTVYHGLPANSVWKERARKLDHAAIYWHIAGSYAPITLVALREQGSWGWGLFVFIWTCAIAGTVISFARLRAHSNVETICYVAMGLCLLVAFKPLSECVRPVVIWWIVGEGVSYITGAVFYSLNKRKYMHSVFHVFVLGGTICHIISMLYLLEQYL